MTGRRARRALDRIVGAASIEELLAFPAAVRADVYEVLLQLQVPSAGWRRVAAAVARRRAVTTAYVVDRAMALLATLDQRKRHDLYALFGVEPGATADDIRRRWRTLAKQYHPDHSPTDALLFRRLQEAYAILSDPVQRMRYEDTWRRQQGPVVAQITAGTRGASRRRSGGRHGARIAPLQAWSRAVGRRAERTLRAVAVGAALLALLRLGRLAPLPTAAPPDHALERIVDTPAVVPVAPPEPVEAEASMSEPPESVAITDLIEPAPELVAIVEPILQPSEPLALLDPIPAAAEPFDVDVPAAVAVEPPVELIAAATETVTPAAAIQAPRPFEATTEAARAQGAPPTVTPAAPVHASVQLVNQTSVPVTGPIMQLAVALALPEAPTSPPPTDAVPFATLRRIRAHAHVIRPQRGPSHARQAAKSRHHGKTDTHAKTAVAKKLPAHTTPQRPTHAAAQPAPPHAVPPRPAPPPPRPPAPVATVSPGMVLALTAPEPIDLQSAQGFVREFARRYSAHEAMGLLELFTPGATVDGRHGVAIADGFDVTFRRLGDVRLQPAPVELEPMPAGATVRADYELTVPGRAPVRGRAQWVLVRQGGTIRATRLLSATVTGAR